MKANLVKAMGVIATVASVAGAPLMTFAAEGSNSPIPALAAKDLVEGVEIANGNKITGELDKNGNIKSAKIVDKDGKVADVDLLQNVAANGKTETLVFIDGVWDTEYDSKEDGAFEFGGNEYYVAGGVVNQSAMGLQFTGKDGFRFLANGVVVKDHAGLVLYDNEWFMIDKDGNCDTTFNGIYTWTTKDAEGNESTGDFLVLDGEMRADTTGFVAEPKEIKTSTTMKYYVVKGQVWGDGEITDKGSDGASHTLNVVKGIVK